MKGKATAEYLGGHILIRVPWHMVSVEPGGPQLTKEKIMAKGKTVKKDIRKKPEKSLKEKRLAKKLKKADK